MLMNIIVNAAMMRESGALSIYRQFIYQLPIWKGHNRYFIFVDPSMDQPEIEGVHYVQDSNHSKFHYIWWNFFGLKLWLRKNHLTASIFVSLQNIGIFTRKKQIIYYHNAIPLSPYKWSFFKSSERPLAVLKYIYPWVVKTTINSNTQIIVQIPFIKKEFVNFFKVSPADVHVLFPDIKKVSSDEIIPYPFEKNLYHFLYPATFFPYKEHETLVHSMVELQKSNPSLTRKIRIHLTLKKEGCPALFYLIEKHDLTEQFVFNGTVPYEELLTQYKAATGLLFPSTIETLGLPLIEAAMFGLPIVASDLQFAHEVLGTYQGINYVCPFDYKGWAKQIEKICYENKQFQPMTTPESSWKNFFDLINDECSDILE